MNNIHNALLKDEPPDKFAEIVNSFHMEWLQAVQEIEMFSKRINNTPREIILNALDYTMNCIQLRYNHILEYVDKMHSPMTEKEEQLLRENLTTINEMQHTVNSALLGKLQYITSQADKAEYLTRIHDETEELLDWLDRLEDSLAIELCNVLNFKVPLSRSSLANTLKQIVDEVAQDAPEAQRISEVNHVSNLISSSSRLDDIHEIEIEKNAQKLKSLKSRINQLRTEKSPELMALKHKTIFLKDRLQSLENIRTSTNKLRNDSWEQNSDENLDYHGPITSMIFNHLLPHQDRCRLVENLKLLWKNALTENRHDRESIIDIFSTVNLGEQLYSDEIGNFTVDKLGRKIYRKDTDDILYQLNDRNKLVPLSDDEKHVYFYDLCGRYYLDDDSRHRVYKNHDGADEYILDKNGLLVKVREEREGFVYFFDRLGRYYINAEGKHTYRHDASTDEYEIDGLDNLVRKHEQPFYYAPCSSGPITMEENKYLKREVGDVLKKCITKVIVHQPTDPIVYLADLLIKHSDSIKANKNRVKDEQDRFEASHLIHTTTDNSASPSHADIKFINYQFETNQSVTSVGMYKQKYTK